MAVAHLVFNWARVAWGTGFILSGGGQDGIEDECSHVRFEVKGAHALIVRVFFIWERSVNLLKEVRAMLQSGGG